MNLEIKKQPSKFENIKMQETINTEILQKLLASDLLKLVSWTNEKNGEKVSYDNETEQLKTLMTKVKKGKLEVKYEPSKIKYGRVYAKKSLSLGSIRRELRHTLAKDLYVDIYV